MNNQTRMELALQGVRYASNMLVEVIGNHARPRNGFSQETMKLLSDAAQNLSDAQQAINKDIQSQYPEGQWKPSPRYIGAEQEVEKEKL